ncbi:MAG TPA: hypothetical protein VMA83_09075 [Solirubrobacteraceae bacterium]|nr:hypothetical protein [Solirubrobacteraceae bacterium]
MASRPAGRSVKIGEDERTGWSSDRPRRGGASRPADLTTHCSILRPTDRLRYSPGSLLIVLAGDPAEREAFVERLIEERGALITTSRVHALLRGRVDEAELDERAEELMLAAAARRLEARETVVLGLDDLTPEGREPFVRLAASLRRPRHVILVEVPREKVDPDVLPDLNELRRALESGELGAEGIQTALRLGGGSASEVKRILFRPPPRDET